MEMKTSEHIRTSRHIKGFRWGAPSTGWLLRERDEARLALEDRRLRWRRMNRDSRGKPWHKGKENICTR